MYKNIKEIANEVVEIIQKHEKGSFTYDKALELIGELIEGKPEWRVTFNTDLKSDGHGEISVAAQTAVNNGYYYFTWNDRVYQINAITGNFQPTKYIVKDNEFIKE